MATADSIEAAMASDHIDITITQGPPPTRASCAPHGAGGEARFIGRTRPDTHETYGSLVALDYDMHEPLVLQVLSTLANTIWSEYSLVAIRMHHARGLVPVGEPSVDIEVHAAHRNDAFAACRALIDGLKAQAPIFKHERWATGETWATGTPPPGAQQ
jgi:molybdopterin synthase catalytic subunit